MQSYHKNRKPENYRSFKFASTFPQNQLYMEKNFLSDDYMLMKGNIRKITQQTRAVETKTILFWRINIWSRDSTILRMFENF